MSFNSSNVGRFFSPRLFNRWIALSTGLKSIQWITQLAVSLVVTHLIVICPVDSAIQILNNQGLELNSKRLYQRKKKVVVHSLFTSFTKREIRNFHVEVAWWRQRNVQKSVMHVQSCCFAEINLLLFCRFRWRWKRRPKFWNTNMAAVRSRANPLHIYKNNMKTNEALRRSPLM